MVFLQYVLFSWNPVGFESVTSTRWTRLDSFLLTRAPSHVPILPIVSKPNIADAGSSSSSSNSRRAFFERTAAAALTVAAPTAAANAYSVPDLPYAFEALEPYIDAPTMKIHHDKHHATYVANINKATEGKDEKPILDLMEDALSATPVRNSGGGHYNHAFFWDEMAPHSEASKTKPSAQLQKLIDSSFGSMDEMKAKFEAQAAPGAVFGSGWVWVCVNKKGDKLEIVGTPNQDNPLMKGVTKDVMFPVRYCCVQRCGCMYHMPMQCPWVLPRSS